jgi:hypothetical protein
MSMSGTPCATPWQTFMTRAFPSTTSFCSGCPCTFGPHHDHGGGDVHRSDAQHIRNILERNFDVDDGLFSTAAICVIDRQSGGKEALELVGLPLKTLFTYSEIDDA